MNAEKLNVTVAVFSQADQLILVRLEDADTDRATADAAGRGYEYAGNIAVIWGVPKVQIEPGFEAAVASAGIVFAEMIGPMLKQVQLESAGI